MPTTRELITDAYQISGVRGTNEAPTGDDTAFALRLLNTDVIDQLRLDSLMPAYVQTYTFNTVPGQWEYTVGVPTATGPAPDVAVSQQIIRIEWAQTQIGNVWTPMRQISDSDYYRQTIAQGSQIPPSQFAFNRVGDPYDRFMLNLGPSGVYPIRLACNGIIKNLQLDDEIALPSGYYATFKYALATLLAESSGLTETADRLNAKFSQCKHRVETVNAVPPPMLKTSGGTGLWSVGVDQVLYSNSGI
jgi:hypothetical protein